MVFKVQLKGTSAAWWGLVGNSVLLLQPSSPEPEIPGVGLGPVVLTSPPCDSHACWISLKIKSSFCLLLLPSVLPALPTPAFYCDLPPSRTVVLITPKSDQAFSWLRDLQNLPPQPGNPVVIYSPLLLTPNIANVMDFLQPKATL
jgi:hypothetical protein